MREKFTDDQWTIISSTPIIIGSAMAMAGKSGMFGSIKEILASGNVLSAGGEKYPSNPLIQSIILDVGLDQPEAQENIKVYRDKMMTNLENGEVSDPKSMAEFAVQNLQKSIILIQEIAYPKDIDEYKQWIMGIGQTVAEVAKEGGFLGIGGEQVSQPEVDFLNRLKAILDQ